MSTYVPIQAITLSAAASSVTFSGIPQTFTDLVLVCNTIVASGTGFELSLQFNDDTGTNYSNTYLLGNGSAAVSGRGTNFAYADCGYLSANAGNPNTRIINIQNYSNTTTNKTLASRASGENGQQVTAYTNLWRSTAAINKIKVYSASSLSYASGSTFTLYGISSGAPKAFGGDIVRTDGTYWYHAFTKSGKFMPVQTISADVLVVGGGGGGGSEANGGPTGGGGGAGGLRVLATQSLGVNISYTCTIGAGGTGAPSSSTTRVNNGNNTSFSGSGLSTITASAGGGGGCYNATNVSVYSGAAGGSGGGSSSQGNTTATGGSGNLGSYSPVEGYAGGSSTNTLEGVAAGGGGAGGVGSNNTSAANAGKGGDGVSVYNFIDFSGWLSVTGTGSSGKLAGGGGGGGRTGTSYPGPGSGGIGGGGTGGASINTNGGAAVANTGSGGGGSANGSGSGGNGGSGIVIVRYAV